jgi:16S rRNA (guanine966-N2)-methyltransferase
MHIQAGRFKGRVLLGPPVGSVTRPITGLAKKSLFDTLADWMPEALVVDLYCGTGSMGLEALSRGARRVAFGEMDRPVLDRLRRNIDAIGAGDACVIWPGDVTRDLSGRLEELGEKVDLAFVDPPYADLREWDWPAAETALFAPLARHLADDGVVVLRMPEDAARPAGAGSAGGVEVLTLAGLTCRKVKRFGNMVLAIMGREKKLRNPDKQNCGTRNPEPGKGNSGTRNQEPGKGNSGTGNPGKETAEPGTRNPGKETAEPGIGNWEEETA